MPHIVACCTDWQPDVLVCDETDFGAMLAAERLGLPQATVLVMAAGSFVRSEVVGEVLNELRREHGLPADPELEMLSRHLVLSPFPRSFRDPAYPLPATAHAFRPSSPALRGGRELAGLSAPAGRPTVYFTLGTSFNLESGDLLARVVRALRELAIRLVVTVGHGIDPAELGRQPSNVTVARYLPQSSVLPHCRAVVSHGGSGSVMGALAHGLPSVLMPLGADQPSNARRADQLGVARVLDATSATPEDLRAFLVTVLEDPSYQRRALRLRDEIAALPSPGRMVRLLERLAEERRPIRSA